MHNENVRGIDEVVASGPFSPTWESLQGYRVPRWYEDAKFGIFVHWGLYAVPAFGNEWYPRNMYLQGTPEFEHHLATYGPQKGFGHKDFIPLFTAERFDPDAWAALFRQAGAQFVVPVAEHHDGFAMYDCGFSDWTAAKMGPKRDLIGELAAAVRRQFLVFGLSSHRAEHWWFFNGGMAYESDVQDPRFAGLYAPAQPKELQPNEEFLDDWLARTCELIDKYQPQLVWFDWWIEEPAFASYLQRFAAYYYNRAAGWQRGVAINYKFNAFREGSAVFDVERGQLDDQRARFWQTDTAVSKNSWGYIQNHDYRSAGDLIGDLVDIVSKNGALLLNVGPRPDGTIPEPEQDILREMGAWLKINGEAIYGTRPWRVYGEGPTKVVGGSFNDTKRPPFTRRDIRFTTRGEVLYAVALAIPSTGRVEIESLGTDSGLFNKTIGSVEVLNGLEAYNGPPAEPVPWTRQADKLVVGVPEGHAFSHAIAFRITPAGPA